MKRKLTTEDISHAALGIALMTVCSWLSIPLTVPFTLQTFAVCLVSALLGTQIGLLSVGSYIAVLLGATGGYIIGFLFTVLIVGPATEHFGRKLPVLLISMAAGILVCYAFGTVWFMTVYAKNSGTVGVMTALGWCVFPYLLPDAVKIALAALLTLRLYPILQRKKGF